MAISLVYLAILVFLAVFVGLRRLLHFLKKSDTPKLTQLRIHFPASVPLSVEAENSLPRSLWKCDVFLSFRGTDVRKSFVSHMYKALNKEGIKVFHDDREPQRGSFIWDGLVKAIDQSRFAIVVISKGYATSRWCLEELSLMAHLAEKKRLELIRIFYEIDPSDLKRRTGCLNDALEKHELRYDLETVGRWRMALAQVGNISGWDSKRTKNLSLYKKLFEIFLTDCSQSHPATQMDWLV